MLKRIVNRSKALLDAKVDHRLSNLEWIEAICGKRKTPIVGLNLYGLSRGINGLAFNRINILLFKENSLGLHLSLNMGTFLKNSLELDSS